MIYIFTYKSKKVSSSFKATVGVKQGGPASPDFFNDFIDELIARLETNGETYLLGGVRKGVMVYADDTTVVCETLNNLNK